MSSDDCPHDIVVRGLCVMCMKDVTIESFESAPANANISMTHDARGLFVSQKAAERLERETAERLRKCRKLSLILDLDQTVIHATIDPTVGEWMNDTSNPSFPALTNVFKFTLPEAPTVYYIKLRPGTAEFLEKAHELYEMHIYTMGTRNYAEAVARIIDPTSKYFNHRILSRDESGSFKEKKIGRLFPGEGERMAVVLDDRGDVWDWCRNLIRIKPYDFFLGIADINEPGKLAAQKQNGNVVSSISPLPPVESAEVSTESESADLPKEEEAVPDTRASVQLLKNRPTLRDDDKELINITTRMQNIHAAYFSSLDERGDGDVRHEMDIIRKRVLNGCEIVLSGVVPVGFDPRRHDLYRFATIFGAVVSTDVGPSTTHVVAAKPGTEKVNKAFKRGGIHVLHPDWLYHCAIAWTRLPETQYLLVNDKPTLAVTGNNSKASSSHPTPHGSSADDSEQIDVEFDNVGDFDIGGIDWGDADAEINEALDGSDDESGEGGSRKDEDEKGGEEEIDWADLLEQEIEGAMGEMGDDSHERQSDGGDRKRQKKR